MVGGPLDRSMRKTHLTSFIFEKHTTATALYYYFYVLRSEMDTVVQNRTVGTLLDTGCSKQATVFYRYFPVCRRTNTDSFASAFLGIYARFRITVRICIGIDSMFRQYYW